MQFHIRKAALDDLNHLVHHRRAMFEEMGYCDLVILNQVDKSSHQYFGQALPAGSYHAWLAEDASARVVAGGGIVIADWPGYPGESLANRAWILNMYTEPEARRRGLAKMLMQVMLDWCRAEGFRTVSLHASQAGRPLYQSIGFQPTNEMRITL